MTSPYLDLFRYQLKFIEDSKGFADASRLIESCAVLLVRPEEQCVVKLEHARICFYRGDWEACLKFLDQVELLEQFLSAADHSLFYLVSARLHQGYGDLNQALSFLEQAVIFAESCEGAILVESLIEIGGLFHRLGERDRGDEFLGRAQALAEDGLEPELLASLYVQRGLLAYRADRIVEAQENYHKALELLRNPEQPSLLRGEIRRYLGVLASVDGRLKEALELHRDALLDFLFVAHPLGCAKAYNSLGQTCLRLANHQEARFFLEQAEQLCRELGAEAERATILGKLGRVYAEVGQHEKAILFQKQDLELSSRFGNYRALAYALRNLGLSYRAKLEFETAIAYLRDSLSRFEELEDYMPQVYTCLELVSCCIELALWQEAQDFLKQALGLLEKRLEVTPDHARACYYAGFLARKRGENHEAEVFLWQALEQSEPFALADLRTEIHFELGELYEANGDHQGALEQLILAYRLTYVNPRHRLAFLVVEKLYRLSPKSIFEVLVS